MSAANELGPGTVVGDSFRVERSLSAGGMGAVYVATQLKTGRLRALKIMHPGLAKEARFVERFEQEAQVGARIASEHVVEVVDAGFDQARGVAYLAMELLEGTDLEERVSRGGPLGLGEVRRIYAELGHALGRAHAAGIVHRDLKPENVFLATSRRAGADYTVKILDFGIAKVLAEATSKATQTIGSPLWMAPEQTTPGAAITPVTDLWPLGLMAFYLLTGRSYWLTASAPAPSAMMLLREVAYEPLPPATERARALGCAHRLPPGFDAWFGRAVVREPASRFGSVTELLTALDALDGAASAGASALGPTTPSTASGGAPSQAQPSTAWVGTGQGLPGPATQTDPSLPVASALGLVSGPPTGGAAAPVPSGPPGAASLGVLPHTMPSPGVAPHAAVAATSGHAPASGHATASGHAGPMALPGSGPVLYAAPPPALPLAPHGAAGRRGPAWWVYLLIGAIAVAGTVVLVLRLRAGAVARRDRIAEEERRRAGGAQDPSATAAERGAPSGAEAARMAELRRALSDGSGTCQDLAELFRLCNRWGDEPCASRTRAALRKRDCPRPD
ncbi:MAG: protein kinase [Myxococcales bacterium]|nr:protein kinase [Myxococcales bacterium]